MTYHDKTNEQTHPPVIQPKLPRKLLLSVLGYEAAGALLGGSLLVAAPDGH
ncbi:hypothetical protein GCM10027275_10140 [Rhabdobacter roseus]|uniref:Uncharacterized protein n=1 Tax=Rhabdobacter roseus TaxID=1655419 RepID=A0A840TMD5_9BACT|nr:hypothetical protein [Rhabdobacter roseus]MBB5282917.1 hypothetical protein [Rhabdobacter roseus]